MARSNSEFEKPRAEHGTLAYNSGGQVLQQMSFAVKRNLVDSLRFGFRHAKRFLQSTKLGRSLLYDVTNEDEFASLRAHERMIGSPVRVNAYREGIRRNIKPGDTVVDLGTGTGILSLFAAQQKPRWIYAIDHSDFLPIARKIAEHNGVRNITFVPVNSRDFKLDEKVDVILHEQLSDDIFGENMIDNLLDLKRRILKKSGIILPGKFELFLEPVSLKPDYRVPFIWEKGIHGFDFSFLRGEKALEAFKRRGYQWPYLVPGAVDYFLCEPAPALAFDMNTWGDDPALPASVTRSCRVVRAGEMDGLCLYFRAIFDEDTDFDTSPMSRYVCWANYFFRTESKHYLENATIRYSLSFGEISKIETWRLEIS